MRWWRGVRDALGERVAIAAAIFVIAGLVAFATGLGVDERARTFATLIASWLFFAGLVAGGGAFRAFFRLVAAEWARPLSNLGSALLGFAPIAFAILVVIALGSGTWLNAAASAWMSGTAVGIRELVLTAALFGGGFLLRPGAERDRRPQVGFAIAYLIAFAIVLSLWGFDFVLGADATFESTLIGGFVFMSSFTAGTGLVVLLALRHGLLAERARRDAAGLVFALAIFWAYLFWSQYLTIWYGNLPDEVAFALRRAGGWGWIVLAVIGLVFAVPFVTLLHPAGRRSPRVLGIILAFQLFGLWLCCQLLLVPSLTPVDAPVLAIRDALVALGMLGAFALSVARGLKNLMPKEKTHD
jgi:hypothetical protein